MYVAQQLYEGIEIATGSQGLITYMRTDGLYIAKEAVNGQSKKRQQALKCKDKPSVIVPLFSIFNLSKLLSALDFSSNSSKADTLPL